MKNTFVISVFLLITSLSCLSVEFPFRTWTSSSGVRIEARLIGKSGDKLTIERSDSETICFSTLPRIQG